MRFFASVLGMLMLSFCLLAQCPATQAQPPSKSVLPPTAFYQTTPAAAQYELVSTPEELNFLANGPRLYPMDKALELSRATGKPVICWMGRHLFSDERARDLSNSLKDTTIQAAMDTDGTPYDAVGPRLKFSTGNYGDDAKTYYVPLAKFDRPGTTERVLAKARGGR